MSIWDVPNVDAQPELTIECWGFIRVINDWHLSGYVPRNLEGRVSSAIVALDLEGGRVETKSGRVYRLMGAPGLNPDAEYVLAQWLAIYGTDDYEDITDEVVARERTFATRD